MSRSIKIAAAAIAAAGCVSAQAAPCDRACLIDVAERYLAAIGAHDPSRAPLATDVAFVENVTALEVGQGLWESAAGTATSFRIYVPDEVEGTIGLMTVIDRQSGDRIAPAQLAARLKIVDGRIAEAEHLVADVPDREALDRLKAPRPGLAANVAERDRAPRAALAAIAASYYDSLDESDGTLAPFAADCERQENGHITAGATLAPAPFDSVDVNGKSPPSVARDCIGQMSSRRFAYIDSIDERRIFAVDPVQGLAMGLSHFRQSMTLGPQPMIAADGTRVMWQEKREPYDLPAAHIFKITGGQIHQVEAIGIFIPYNSPTGWEGRRIVVGSGNYFSPIVRDLDAALAFYRDGLGLEVQGAPGDASMNAALRNMFGLPDARIRWAIARTPAAAGGVEMVEIGNAGGKPLDRRLQDPGAISFVATVRDLDATLARLKRLGAPVVSIGGEPVTIGAGTRIVIVKDPDGHFVELSQPAELPATQAPPTANVVGVRLRLAVDDVETAVRLYRDELGLEARAPVGDYGDNKAVLDALGLTSGQYRVGLQSVPASGLMYDFVDFKGVERRKVDGRIQDFGSTRVQLRVRDVDAAIAAFERFGGKVVSTGGRPLDLPAGNSTLKVAIVRDPNNLFVVLIESPPL